MKTVKINEDIRIPGAGLILEKGDRLIYHEGTEVFSVSDLTAPGKFWFSNNKSWFIQWSITDPSLLEVYYQKSLYGEYTISDIEQILIDGAKLKIKRSKNPIFRGGYSSRFSLGADIGKLRKERLSGNKKAMSRIQWDNWTPDVLKLVKALESAGWFIDETYYHAISLILGNVAIEIQKPLNGGSTSIAVSRSLVTKPYMWYKIPEFVSKYPEILKLLNKTEKQDVQTIVGFKLPGKLEF